MCGPTVTWPPLVCESLARTPQQMVITGQSIPVLTGVNKDCLHMGQVVMVRYSSILHAMSSGAGLACGSTHMVMKMNVKSLHSA